LGRLGNIGYQIYNIQEGLLIVGSADIKLLDQSSLEDLRDLISSSLDEAQEEDLFLDHKINRGILVEN
jgi:hypothetical protein